MLPQLTPLIDCRLIVCIRCEASEIWQFLNTFAVASMSSLLRSTNVASAFCHCGLSTFAFSFGKHIFTHCMRCWVAMLVYLLQECFCILTFNISYNKGCLCMLPPGIACRPSCLICEHDMHATQPETESKVNQLRVFLPCFKLFMISAYSWIGRLCINRIRFRVCCNCCWTWWIRLAVCDWWWRHFRLGVGVTGVVEVAQSTTMVDLVVELLEQWPADDARWTSLSTLAIIFA